jgi:hypothetical protein
VLRGTSSYSAIAASSDAANSSAARKDKQGLFLFDGYLGRLNLRNEGAFEKHTDDRRHSDLSPSSNVQFHRSRLLFAAANRKDSCRDTNRGHRGRIMLHWSTRGRH